MVTPNIWMACWMWRIVVIMATSKRGRRTRARHTGPTGLFISEPRRARVLLKECGSWYGGFPFALRGSEQLCTHAAWLPAPSLLARDAMLARYSLSSSVRLSLCPPQACIVSKRLDESSWFLAQRLPSTYPTLTVTRKFGYLQKLKYFPLGGVAR